MRMRRMNVIIDEELLEQALRILKERNYSSTLNAALRRIVNEASVDSWMESMSEGDPWLPGYVEEILDEDALALYRLPPEELRARLRNRHATTDMIADSPMPEPKRKGRGRGSR